MNHQLRYGMKAVLATSALVISLVLGGCDSFPSDRLVAVSRDETGRLVGHVFLCPGDTVRGFDLSQSAGSSFRTLWVAESPAGTPVDRVVIGMAPPGFFERVPLREEPQGHLALTVSLRNTNAGVSFSAEKLRPGVVYTGEGRYLTEREFMERARGRCRGE